MLPGFFGCGFVVAGGRVVVEAVIGAFVDVTLVRHMRHRQGGIERLPSALVIRVSSSPYCALIGALILAVSAALG